ncbi:MAG: hypothetical protein Q4B88_06180 [Moraxella sp.]|nr:hypothetical protein [Moraxella sp.]
MSYRALFVAVSFLCVTAHANPTAQPAITETVTRTVINGETAGVPVVAVAMTEEVNGIRRNSGTNVVSRSNPNQHLCWQTSGFAVQEGQLIEETIVSPASMRFTDPNAQIFSTNNGTLHRMYSNVQKSSNGVGKCWQFGSTDPVGDYMIELKIGDVNFPALPFVVTP